MDGADEEMVFVSETGFSIFSGSKAGMSIGVEDELTIDSDSAAWISLIEGPIGIHDGIQIPPHLARQPVAEKAIPANNATKNNHLVFT